MKKRRFMLAKIGFVMTILLGCGGCGNSNENSVTGANGKSYDSYREACRDGDFVAAHKFLDKLKDDAQQWDTERTHKIANEAEEYIYKQEALFLMSQNDDAAKKRLIYLIKEEERGNELVEMIIDLAVEEKDCNFVKILANQLTDKAKDECLNKVGVFLFSNGSQEDIDFAFSLFEKFKKKNELLTLATNNLVVEKDNVKLTERLMSILASAESKIPAKPKVGRFWQEDYYYKENVCDPYTNAVKKYNDQCHLLLNLAIKSKNQTFAKTVLGKVKSNINSILEESTWDHRHRYNITIDNDDIKSANAIYQEAVRNGVFN